MNEITPFTVLVIWPPEVPAYFNAGHHLPIFMVSAYLRSNIDGISVTALDAGALNYSWKDLANLLATESFDMIAIMNDFGSITGIRPLIRYARALQPTCKLLTFGRLSHQIPGFFERYDLDAIVQSGDYEAGVAAATAHFAGLQDDAPGVRLRVDRSWRLASPGKFLRATDWPFPDVSEIPFEAYERQYLDDSRKFCGIPERRELVVVVARGCPIGCAYCEVPMQQGRRERRRPVAQVVAHIEEVFENRAFEYVSFYAPTFTLDRDWVLELCDALITRHSKYPWKCVTTLHHLDLELINQMGASGCVRISVGLETLEHQAQFSLPKLKRKSHDRLAQVAGWCRDAGIELNCFVILGLPGESAAGARATLSAARALGARVRPTLYTPYQAMTESMDEAEIESFDRQLPPLASEQPDDAAELFSLLHGRENTPTKIMNRVSRRT